MAIAVRVPDEPEDALSREGCFLTEAFFNFFIWPNIPRSHIGCGHLGH
jgi:hypothetical protein